MEQAASITLKKKEKQAILPPEIFTIGPGAGI